MTDRTASFRAWQRALLAAPTLARTVAEEARRDTVSPTNTSLCAVMMTNLPCGTKTRGGWWAAVLVRRASMAESRVA